MMKRLVTTSILMLASLGIGQQQTKTGLSATRRTPQSTCVRPQCIVVHVDGVSKGLESNPVERMIATVRLSDSKRTYQLTCNPEIKTCVLPTDGAEYQLIAIPGEKPEDLEDHEGEYPHYGKTAFLKAANVRLGPYWMVAEMPPIQTSAFQRLIAECSAREQGLNENDCIKWLARRARMQEAGCPDPDAAVACHSFQQLLGAADPDIMDLFARLEHVYVCFYPQEDAFFSLWFSEPSEWHWRKANADEQKVFGVQNGSLIQIAGPGVYYYNKGVQDENAHISELGVWSYLPLSSDITPSSLALLATSSDAKFGGKTFQIDGTRVAVSESYKNRDGTTGRFAETYDDDPSGHTFLNYIQGAA
jgi:hypothetical protein